ncbi:response regulator transcription factor, partial [Escherichia coli]|uniref:response regulator transcription factor n=1 Tax=Escherichia coli TaxID=562 RepID=UPI0023B2A056
LELTQLLTEILTLEGFQVTVAEDGEEGLQRLAEQHFNLVLLDVMMPKLNGFAMLARLRKTHDTPVLMLTARGDSQDRVNGLEAGADDYLAKPFNPRELLARIKAVMRRTQVEPQPAAETLTRDLRFDRWLLDINRRELVDEEGVGLSLSTAEFDLLRVFLERPQRVLSRDQLLDLARGRE